MELRRKTTTVFLVLIFFLFFAIYLYISYYFFSKQHYIHSNLIFFAEKALVAVKGYPPRLENIGFVYPPLAFLPFLVFNNPLIIPSFVSSFLGTLFIWFAIKHKNSYLLDILLLILILFNPLYLFLATQRFDVLLFYCVLSLSILYGLQYIKKKYSIYLFLQGMLLGITFFIDFRSIFVAPIIIFGIYMTIKGDLPYKLSAITVVLMPLVFFSLAWVYLNWIFTGDPFTFIKSPYSFFRVNTVFISTNSLFSSLKYGVKILILSLPITFPYYLLMLLVFRFRKLYSTSIFLIYLSPIFLFFSSIYFNLFFPNYYTAILLLLFAAIFSMHFLNLKSRLKKTMLFGFAISFLFSFILPVNSKNLNESYFIKVLLGENVNRAIKNDKSFQTAAILKTTKCKNILTDDTSNFKVVYFAGKPKKFILPYNYEFSTFISNPQHYADCLLISKSSNDTLLSHFPDANNGFLEGFYLIYDNGKYMIYRRSYE
jgi:hypothetical protein